MVDDLTYKLELYSIYFRSLRRAHSMFSSFAWIPNIMRSGLFWLPNGLSFLRSLLVGQQQPGLKNTAHTVRSCLICEFLQISWLLSDGIVGDSCWIAANYTVQRIVYVFKLWNSSRKFILPHSLDYMVVGFLVNFLPGFPWRSYRHLSPQSSRLYFIRSCS
jgi:hypothetical protein